MKNKLLSIIVPAFNVEEYIKNSIDSLAYFLNRNDVEIIIINDGSTDNTFEEAKKLESVYANLSVIDRENAGLSATRNLGNKIANGEYIYFFDGDDYLCSKYTRTVLEQLKKGSYDVFCFGYSKVNEIGEKISLHIYDKKNEFSQLNENDFIKSLVGDDSEPIAGYLPTKIIRHELIRNIKFKHMNYEDMPFLFDILCAYKKSSLNICYYNRTLYNYVQRNNSITHSSNEQNMCDKLKSVDIIMLLLDEIDVEDEIKYLNYRRTLITCMWVSSLNIHGVKSKKVAYQTNMQMKKIPFLLNINSYAVSPYVVLKRIYYSVKNKFIYGRGALNERH